MGISDDIEATLAQLDNLHAGERARKAETFGRLQAIVANLDVIPPQMTDEYPEAELHPRREDPRQAPPEAGEGFGEVSIPQPRAFAPFGDKVKAKLIREALEKPSW